MDENKENAISPLPPVLLSSSFQPQTSPPPPTTVVIKLNKATDQPILIFERKFNCEDTSLSVEKLNINVDQLDNKQIETTDPSSHEKMASNPVLAHHTNNMSENVDDETIAISDSKTDGERHMPEYLIKVDDSDTENKQSDNGKNDNGNNFSDNVTIVNVFGKTSNIDIEEQTGCEKTEIDNISNQTKCNNFHNDCTQENTTEFQKIFLEENTGTSDHENENAVTRPNDVAENMTNKFFLQIPQTDNTSEVTEIQKISTLDNSNIKIVKKIVKVTDVFKEVPGMSTSHSAMIVWRDHSYAMNHNSQPQNSSTSLLCSQSNFADFKVKPNKKQAKKKSQPQNYLANSKLIHNTLMLTERVWKDHCYDLNTKSKRKVINTSKYSTLAKNNSEKFKLEMNRVYDDSGISSQANYPEDDLVNSDSVNENLKNLKTDIKVEISENINEVVNSSGDFPESTVNNGVIICNNIKVEYDAEERDETLNDDYGQCTLEQEEIHIKPEPIDHSETETASETESASETENYNDSGDVNLLEPVYTADWCCTTNSYVIKYKIQSKISKTLPQAPIERHVPAPQAKKLRKKRKVYKRKSKTQNKRESDVCAPNISRKRMKTDSTEKTNLQKTKLKKKKMDPSQPKRQSTRLQSKRDERNCSDNHSHKDIPSDPNNRLDQSVTVENEIKNEIENKTQDVTIDQHLDLLKPVYSVSYCDTLQQHDRPLDQSNKIDTSQSKRQHTRLKSKKDERNCSDDHLNTFDKPSDRNNRDLDQSGTISNDINNEIENQTKDEIAEQDFDLLTPVYSISYSGTMDGPLMDKPQTPVPQVKKRRKKGKKLMYRKKSKTQKKRQSEVEGYSVSLFMPEKMIDYTNKTNSHSDMVDHNLSLQSKTNIINKHSIEDIYRQESVVDESSDHLTIKSEFNNILSHPISENTELHKKSTSNHVHFNERLPDQSNQTWNQSDIDSEIKDMSKQSSSGMNTKGNASNTLNFFSNNIRNTYEDEFIKFLPLLE